MRMDEIRKLIKLLEESDLHEIEVARWWGLGRVRLTKNSTHRAAPDAANGHGAPAAAPPASAPTPAAVAPAVAVAPPVAAESRYVAIKSPMVGTFYRAPAPDADPYVEVGQLVDVGQTVCIVEAMKLMNEIEADARGRIVAIKVDNKQPVEYGQVLFLIDPQG
jgi:oxaloacetate decarboxylase alpha subunit